jgi:hypothetical protein
MRKIVSSVAGVYGVRSLTNASKGRKEATTVRMTSRLAVGSAGDGMDRYANIEPFHETNFGS